jgi:hypothetical protein
LTDGIDNHHRTRQESNTLTTPVRLIRRFITINTAGMTFGQFKKRDKVRLHFLHFTIPHPIMTYARAKGIPITDIAFSMNRSSPEDLTVTQSRRIATMTIVATRK